MPKFGWMLACLLACASCSDTDLAPLQVSGSTMGTYYRVLAYCEPQSSDQDWEALLAQELSLLNATFSSYDDSSELMRFNGAEQQAWHALSPELMAVLQASERVHLESSGAFDITVAPLVAAWGFGPTASTELPPSEANLAVLRARVGQQFLQLDPSVGQAQKQQPVQLDLSAVAKGYAVDVLSQRLSDGACHQHLVDIGGEVRAKGAKPSGQPWRVGIEIPSADQMGGVARALQLGDQAVATSGDYRNYVAQDNARWSHTIDPRSGLPVEHRLASVTVVLPTTMLADAWATAFTVLGAEQALAYAEPRDWPVLTIERRATQSSKASQSFDERFEVRYTSAMGKLLTPANEDSP